MSVAASASRASRRTRTGGPLALLVLASLAAAAFYVGAFALRGLQAPLADDSFFYVSAVRTATGSGLANAHLLARPAFPILGATLGSPADVSAWTVAVGTPIAMAIGMGLAGAALAERWDLPRWAAGAFSLMVALSSLAARLVAGKDETLLTLWLLAAVLSVATWAEGRRGSVAVAVLALVAGLAEWPFLALFLAIAVFAFIASIASGRRGGGGPASGGIDMASVAGTLAVAAVGVAIVVFAINGTGIRDAVQRLPPSFRYGLRLRDETAALWPLPTLGLFLIGWWAARLRRPAGARITWGVLMAWVAVAVVGLAVGLAGAKLPTYRVVTFALPLALGAAAAPIAPAVAAGRRVAGPRVAAAAVAVAAAGLALMPATFQWFRDLRPRTNAREMGEVVAAAAYAAAQPGGGPVVLVVDRTDAVLGAFYDRVVAAVLVPERSRRLLVFLGRAEDALAGRATLSGSPSRDRVFRERFGRDQQALRAGAPVLSGAALDPAGFAAARADGSAMIPGGVAVTRGPGPPPGLMAKPFDPLPRWWALLAFVLGALAVLALAGGGWARLALPDAPATVRWGLAPAFGASGVVVIALVLERAGLNPRGGVALTTAALAVAASTMAWTLERNRARRAAVRPGA